MEKKDVITICEALEKFAKRSKNIAIKNISHLFVYQVDIEITKEGKVYREMMDYLNNVCSFYERIYYSNNNYCDWFNSYDNNDSEADNGDYGIEICIANF